ncbi:diaminobutyrate--2-oxoglutarate transaminase [Marinicrinis lubricantis]|uniref:Diaminobutyrate--2-oxoglutarate transaminase n=1 Tax=Marinicrinis lubricantis TaxID=2086470 RepID=A0ABW1IM85_9BACL
MSIQIAEQPKITMDVFEQWESEVRSYCRSFPTVFSRAKNARMWDTAGNEYIDFFAGAGSLNYGHNNDKIKQKLVEYILEDGVTHSLDMATVAKGRLLESFVHHILKPRNMNYKVMFPGPTGTNSVESALKLARKITGRETVISFTNGFHGMTLGSLAVTGNKFKRQGAGVPLHHTVSMPFCKYHGDEADTIAYIEKYLEDSGSGLSLPAAMIIETVQGEGGVNVASDSWLRKLSELCKRFEILLIVDDIQVGCGRTGTFFSFEKAGIEPDIICLSKSIGGYGLPLALTLFKPELDIWEPGEHNGTFRGNNLGFVAATEAINYWKDSEFEQSIQHKGQWIEETMQQIKDAYPQIEMEVRGRGMMRGIAFTEAEWAEKLCRTCFENGLIMETAGTDSEVAKVMPALTIEAELLQNGLNILKDCARQLFTKAQ